MKNDHKDIYYLKETQKAYKAMGNNHKEKENYHKEINNLKETEIATKHANCPQREANRLKIYAK